MNLETFKNHYMYRPEHTTVIDRPFILDGNEMHLIALTYKDNSYTLWVMDCLSEEISDSEMTFDPSKCTNRDSFEKRKTPNIRSIESLEVGGHTFEFNGSSTDSFHFQGNTSIHKLQYFIDQGIELSHWDDVSLNKFQLTAHKNSGFVSVFNVDVKDKAIKLKLRAHHKEIEVFNKYSLNFNLNEPVELKYYNPFEEKQESFYVHRFETYDLKNYIDSIENSERYKDIPKEHIEKMIEMITEYFEDLKRRNSSLILMTYEADRGLSFQSTEYLDRKIEIASSNSSGSMGFFFKPNEINGSHGKRLFIASFHDVPNDCLETIEFELHYVSKEYPEKIIKV